MTFLPSDVNIIDVYILYDIFENSDDSRKAFPRPLYVPGLYHNFYNRAKIFVRLLAEFSLCILHTNI